MEWLRRLIRRVLGRKEPEPEVSDVGQVLRRYQEERVKPLPRRGIRSTDLGMRKVARHGRRGRQFEKRSGIDHTKRMVDIEDGQTRPRRKKKGWFEDRKRRDG